jgi:hypothetical protein
LYINIERKFTVLEKTNLSLELKILHLNQNTVLGEGFLGFSGTKTRQNG